MEIGQPCLSLWHSVNPCVKTRDKQAKSFQDLRPTPSQGTSLDNCTSAGGLALLSQPRLSGQRTWEAMRRRWIDLLMGFAAAALHNPLPSSAAAVSLAPTHTSPPAPQNTFYINRPANNANREVIAGDGRGGDHGRAQPGSQRPQAERRLVFDTSGSRTALDDWVLEDYVLVATIEGNLYALDRYSGATRWVLDGQGAAVQAVGSRYISDPANTTKEQSSSPRWIVQPVEGGQLFVFDQEFGVVVRSRPGCSIG